MEVTVSSGPDGPGRSDPAAGRAAAPVTADAANTMCHQQFDGMRTGDLALFEAHVHPAATNREATDEPLDCRGRGPAAFLATGNMLRGVFADLTWDVREVVVDGDLVVAHTLMSGRQAGTFHRYDARGRAGTAFPSRGRSFAVTQTHWWRMRDGLMVEHWANRDDMAMALQLGWIPPTPAYIARMVIALRRARRIESRRGGPVPEGLECRPAAPEERRST